MSQFKNLFLFLLLFTSNASFAQYITHIAGNDSCGYNGDGSAAINASLGGVRGICIDVTGNLYFAVPNGTSNQIVVRKITAATGIIHTIAGGGIATADNMPATSLDLNSAEGLCVDAAGNVYVANTGDPWLWKINQATGMASVMAGNGIGGYSGDGGPATSAEFNDPYDESLDTANNLYISDIGANVIRKVTEATGIINTIAGTGAAFSYGGDGGPATAAMLDHPEGIYVDRSANIYIADANNNRVRMVTAATGIINTIAGDGAASDTGDGGPATAAGIKAPQWVTLDPQGNIYISNGIVIRRVDAASRVITTYAGNGAAAFTLIDSAGDGGPATAAQMAPQGMCFDSCGNLFYGDHCRLRVITPAPYAGGKLCDYLVNSVPEAMKAGSGMQVYPNPAHGQFTITIASYTPEPALILITNIMGQKVKEINAVTGKPVETLLDGPPGMYFIEAVTASARWRAKVVISP